jgi:hypothetical protein
MDQSIQNLNYLFIYLFYDNGFTKASNFYLIVMLNVAFMKYIFH